MGSHVDWKEGNKKYNTYSKNNENTVTNTIFILSCFYLLGGSYHSISTPSPFPSEWKIKLFPFPVSLSRSSYDNRMSSCLKKKKCNQRTQTPFFASPITVVDLWPPWRSARKLCLHIEMEWLHVSYIWMIVRKGSYFLRLVCFAFIA